MDPGGGEEDGGSRAGFLPVVKVEVSDLGLVGCAELAGLWLTGTAVSTVSLD